MKNAPSKAFCLLVFSLLAMLSVSLLNDAKFNLITPAAALTGREMPEPVSACTDFFECQLIEQINRTADFLERNRNGKLLTVDPRPVQPFSEMVRLNIVTQAGGYLNLYRMFRRPMDRNYAAMRLNYLTLLGRSGLSNGPFDGMLGYVMLQGGELLNNQEFKNFGLSIADDCLTYPWLTLDPGYMCDMALAKAYALTRNQAYLNKLRLSTAETASRQYPNGGFPHWYQDGQHGGPSANYTAWMIEEAYMIRQGDPENPDLTVPIMKSLPFLRSLVEGDGSLHPYPGEPDGVGISTMSSIAYGLYGLGDHKLAQLVLKKLFTKQLSGVNKGAFPDGWDSPDGLWTSTKPSILRTSLVFWDLTNLAADRLVSKCTSGAATTCTITPSDCNPEFAGLGACSRNYAGVNLCLNGAQTKCVNPDLVVFKNVSCTYPPGYIDGQYCNNWQRTPGTVKCIGATCSQCVYNDEMPVPDCLDDWG
ncbi:MAG: hypothetical protein K1X83_10180 [Oligoflexia bacterium]|nr:hypothetical protein [Oligoflexia bacterium]